MDSNSQKRQDGGLLTKEEENIICSTRRMAAIKRERLKEYSFSNRVSFRDFIFSFRRSCNSLINNICREE